MPVFPLSSRHAASAILGPVVRLLRKGAGRIRRLVSGKPPSFRHQPLVSILLVTYNSRLHLPRLIQALSEQVYDSFELIIVDNASTDGSVAVLNELLEAVPFAFRIEALDRNTGFAEGNNLALNQASGELIALLNADAVPAADWLSELVVALKEHPRCSSAAPKILFDSYFVRVQVRFPFPARIDLPCLAASLEYPKFFVHLGNRIGDQFLVADQAGFVCLDLPRQRSPIALQLLPASDANLRSASTPDSARLTLTIGGCERPLTLSAAQVQGREPILVDVSRGWGFRIVNNAGSTTGRLRDSPGDVGFGCADSHVYDVPGRRRRFCGCSVLIRRQAILDRDLFNKAYFAYYEDSELSRWLLRHRRGGIIYWPRAVVLHHHSSTLGEYSPSWDYLTQRSRFLYQQPESLGVQERSGLSASLSMLAEQAEGRQVSPALVRAVRAQDSALLSQLRGDGSMVPYRPAIGVFNLFWKTKGGGEIHALSIACLLAELYPEADVYLLSESDFDLEELGSYFGIAIGRLRKLILPKVSQALTRRFWLFVNATSHSSLPSHALNSWYIVSFPHRVLLRNWLSGYTLLYNSEFTQGWCRAWWKRRCPGQVLYPVRQLRSQYAAGGAVRCRRMVALGRFTERGHAKNHDIIIAAFSQAFQSRPSDWGLELIGSLELDQPVDLAYFRRLQALADPRVTGCRIELRPDLDRHQLEGTLASSLVYVHAAGFGKHSTEEPDLHEHFGIAPVEAAIQGCIPVVYAIGGPAEFVGRCGIGRTYSTLEQLSAILLELSGRTEADLLEESRETARRASGWVDLQAAVPLPALRPFRARASP